MLRLRYFDFFIESKYAAATKNPSFDETFDYKLMTTVEELKAMKVLFCVWNKLPWYRFGHEQIGQYSLDIWTVYNKATKMVNRTWENLILGDDGERGYINFSVMCVAEGDKIMALGEVQDEDGGDDDEGGEGKKKNKLTDLVIGAAPVDKKAFLLTLNIFMGEYPQIPDIKETNIMLRVIINETLQDEIGPINNNRSPNFKKMLTYPLYYPVLLDYIVIEVYHVDSSKHFWGRILIDFKILQKDGVIDAKWYLIYGPIREAGFFKNLKYNWRIGTDIEPYMYYGRNLISARFVPDEEKSPRGVSVTPDITLPENKVYTVWFDVYELNSENLSSGDKFWIEIQVGNYIFPPRESVSEEDSKYFSKYSKELERFIWKERRYRPNKEIIISKDTTQLPDIFIRLCKKGGFMSGDSYVAYKRLSFADVLKKRERVRPVWENLRKIDTSLKGDSEENYIGLLLCAINIFPTDKNYDRPRLIDNRNYKKYKLLSIIYMAKDLPNISSGKVISPYAKVYFNGKVKFTPADKETLNPLWGTGLKIETIINEDISLADSIKLSCWDASSFYGEECIGRCEINLLDIKKYNNSKYIDKDLYEYAKWYQLYDGVKPLQAKVLAAFFIIKLVKQGREEINLEKNYNFLPKEEYYRLCLYIIGVRGVPKSLNLINGVVMVRFNQIELEELDDKEEKFKKGRKLDFTDNNVNNLDTIGSQEDNLTISLSSKEEFVKPVELLVQQGREMLLSGTIDLTRLIFSAPKIEKSQKTKKMKRVLDFTPTQEDINLIYRYQDDHKGKQKQPYDTFLNMYNKFPAQPEEINGFSNDETVIDVFHEEDPNSKDKGGDKETGGFTRPEMDEEYESDLPERELPFFTQNLVMNGDTSGKPAGIIRYLLQIAKKDNLEENKTIKAKFLENIKEIEKVVKKPEYICRLYFLYASSLTPDNMVDDDKAYIWVKRYEEDTELKMDQKAFPITTPEINEMIEFPVFYPETFFLRIQVHKVGRITDILSSNLIIGETELDLEKRIFHPNYIQKIKDPKKFKTIPIESRTLYSSTGEKIAKGALKMWCEIFPKKSDYINIKENLTGQGQERYELRVVIWNTRNVPFQDGWNCVNIRVKLCTNDGKNPVEVQTDCHNNSKDGNGEFNWRFVIPYTFPTEKEPKMDFYIEDVSLLGSATTMGVTTLNAKKYYRMVQLKKEGLDVDRQWLPLQKSGSEDKNEKGGEIELEWKILTKSEAGSNKVGAGRDEPNKDPYLETPKNGRSFLDSLAFLGKLGDFLGGLYDRIFTMLKYGCLIVCIGFVIYSLLQLVSSGVIK